MISLPTVEVADDIVADDTVATHLCACAPGS